jgi:hypothetical protein
VLCPKAYYIYYNNVNVAKLGSKAGNFYLERERREGVESETEIEGRDREKEGRNRKIEDRDR